MVAAPRSTTLLRYLSLLRQPHFSSTLCSTHFCSSPGLLVFFSSVARRTELPRCVSFFFPSRRQGLVKCRFRSAPFLLRERKVCNPPPFPTNLLFLLTLTPSRRPSRFASLADRPEIDGATEAKLALQPCGVSPFPTNFFRALVVPDTFATGPFYYVLRGLHDFCGPLRSSRKRRR